MSLVEKYRWGNNTNIPATNIEIDNLSTLESIKRRQGWMIAAQIATVAAITNQTNQTTDALKLVNETLISIEDTIQNGFDSLESSIERLEANLIENLSEIKWYLFNIDQKLDQIINLVKFSGATKSAEFNRQGFILYKIGSYKDAIIQLEKSIQENPLNIEAYINLGFVYLRLEKLTDSIYNFEFAAKIVKEDFSYFEEISSESIKTTEVFILDNLASLYSLQDKNHLSIELMNKILGKEIDKKTEIISKYKLAKFKCLMKEHDVALEVINELINNQYFEPVALAVANPEFAEIREPILKILQMKLESVKKSFGGIANSQMSKIKNLDIEDNCKKELTELISKSIYVIHYSSDYSTLLTTDFKESFNDYLSYFDLVSEIKLKTQAELIKSIEDSKKLESIAQTNSTIDTNYNEDDEINKISHRILLKKIKNKVKAGIDNKLLTLKHVKSLCETINENIDNSLKKFISISDTDIIEFIYTTFNLSEFSVALISLSFDKSKETTTQSKKLLEEYKGMIDRYNTKQKVSSESSNENFEDQNSDSESIVILDIGNNKLAVIKKIKEILGVDLKIAKDLVEDGIIMDFPSSQLKELRCGLEDLGVDLD